MDMIFVSLHSQDTPAVLFSQIHASSFDEIVYAVQQKFLTILGDKNDMYFSAVFTTIFVMISVLHKIFSSLYLFFH